MNKLKEYIAYVGYAGCALIIIGVFLPLVKFSISLFGYTSSSSVNYFNGDGKILLEQPIAPQQKRVLCIQELAIDFNATKGRGWELL